MHCAFLVDENTRAVALRFCPPTDVDCSVGIDHTVEPAAVRVDLPFFQLVLVLDPHYAVKVVGASHVLALDLVVIECTFCRFLCVVDSLIALSQELRKAVDPHGTQFVPLE